MHWIYLIQEFNNLSWITEINELFHNILIYWDAPVYNLSRGYIILNTYNLHIIYILSRYILGQKFYIYKLSDFFFL